MNSIEYAALDGIALAELIKRGELSRSEVTEAAIQVIRDRNPELNAVIYTQFDKALSQTNTTNASKLDGVPFLLKDVNLYSSDMPTTFGSAYFRDAPPKADSTMVARWRKAGLTFLGKTNSPEFAAEFVTEPRAYGITHNPVAPGLTVGGSSGGAAAAVASGMVPLAHGTDLGGSIRIPAACCGVFGFKPSAGLNPTGPYFKHIAGGLNSDHVLTRTVRDSAASLDITADPAPERASFLDMLSAPLHGIRIGISEKDPMGRKAGPDQCRALAQVARAFETLGHHIIDYSYPDNLETDWFDYLWIFDILDLVEERAQQIGRPPKQDELEPLTWILLDKAKAGGRQKYDDAQIGKAHYTARYLESLSQIDILLTPTLFDNPPPDGVLAFDSFNDFECWNNAGYGFAPFSTPSNISGEPSASCPWIKNSSGLSIGVQITGKPGADLLVLQLSAQLEGLLQGK